MAIPFQLTVDDVIRQVRSTLLDYTDLTDVTYYDVADLVDTAYRRVCLRLLPYIPHAFETQVAVSNGTQLPSDYVADVRCVIGSEEGGYVPARRVDIREWQMVMDASVISFVTHAGIHQPVYTIWNGYDTIVANLQQPATFSTTQADIGIALISSPRIYIAPPGSSGYLVYYSIPSQIPRDAGGGIDTLTLLPLVGEFHTLVVREVAYDVALYIGLDRKELYAIRQLLEMTYSTVVQAYSGTPLASHPIYGAEVGSNIVTQHVENRGDTNNSI